MPVHLVAYELSSSESDPDDDDDENTHLDSGDINQVVNEIMARLLMQVTNNYAMITQISPALQEHEICYNNGVNEAMDDMIVVDRVGFRDARPESCSNSTSSDSSILSDAESDSDLDSDASFATILEQTDRPSKSENHVEKIKKKAPRIPGELRIEDLPAIENLNISVEPTVKLLLVGKVTSIIDSLVIVQSVQGVPALDENTVFFGPNRTSIGAVFETFGPVTQPLYSIRFNTAGEIAAQGISVGVQVFCAPEVEEFTKSVFTDGLRNIKGSDASWEDNIEVPAECEEFSDDEEERKFRSQNRAKHRQIPNNGNNRGQFLPKRGRASFRGSQSSGPVHHHITQQRQLRQASPRFQPRTTWPPRFDTRAGAVPQPRLSEFGHYWSPRQFGSPSPRFDVARPEYYPASQHPSVYAIGSRTLPPQLRFQTQSPFCSWQPPTCYQFETSLPPPLPPPPPPPN